MKLAVLADSHVTCRTDTPQWAALEWAFDAMRNENADCALIAGDITACGDLDGAMLARRALDRCPVRWIATPGNSDMRTPDTASTVARLFASPPGGVRLGALRVVGIDASLGRITLTERARMNIQDRDSTLILLSHQSHEQLDADSRTFISGWIRERVSAGQKIPYWFSGHTHARAQSEFEGVCCITPRALDPDKSIGGMPEMLLVDTDTGEIESREFTSGLFPEWSAAERDVFVENLGITCYQLKEDMRFCIDNGVPHIEWRGVCDPDSETLNLLSEWRRACGRSFSQHLSSLAWDEIHARTVGDDLLIRTADTAARLGANMVTVHPPYESIGVMRADSLAFDALADRMAEILRPLADAGILIMVENSHTRAGDESSNRRFGCTPLDVICWIDSLNARLGADKCALRLDVGHARNNAPVSEYCPLGHWYASVGARCRAYHLHQTCIDASNKMYNHFPITGLDDGLVSFHGFLWSWRSGLLQHGPLILEIREGNSAPQTYLRLRALIRGET